MDRLYNAGPDGYCGDEDNGQTSAWYVFSALGFYPVCPASDFYALGTPYFPKAVVHLENGKEIVINAENGSGAKRGLDTYIGSMKLEGKAHDCNFIRYDSLADGAEIDYVMYSEPDMLRGNTAIQE